MSPTFTGLIVGLVDLFSSGVCAVAVASFEESFPFWTKAVTTVPSATWSAGIVTIPVSGSTVIDGSVPWGNVQFPWGSLVTTRVPCWLFSSV